MQSLIRERIVNRANREALAWGETPFVAAVFAEIVADASVKLAAVDPVRSAWSFARQFIAAGTGPNDRTPAAPPRAEEAPGAGPAG